MDDHAADRDLLAGMALRMMRAEDLAAHRFQNRSERLLHMIHLLQLGVGPLEVESQHRDTPFIDYIGIDFGIGVFVRNHLATARQPDSRPEVPINGVLQIFAVAFVVLTGAGGSAHLRHAESTADFYVITAREIE